MLGGGLVIALGSILDWRTGTSGLSFDSTGLFGILVLLMGLGIAFLGAQSAFGLSVGLPEKIAGLSLGQWALIEAFTCFIWAFALISADFIEAGVHITWLGGAIATVGAVLNLREAPAAATSI